MRDQQRREITERSAGGNADYRLLERSSEEEARIPGPHRHRQSQGGDRPIVVEHGLIITVCDTTADGYRKIGTRVAGSVGASVAPSSSATIQERRAGAASR